jgi:hypothetical protein
MDLGFVMQMFALMMHCLFVRGRERYEQLPLLLVLEVSWGEVLHCASVLCRIPLYLLYSFKFLYIQ